MKSAMHIYRTKGLLLMPSANIKLHDGTFRRGVHLACARPTAQRTCGRGLAAAPSILARLIGVFAL